MTTYTTDTTFTVGAGGDFTTIKAALDSLLGAIIAYDTIVTLQLLAQDYPITEPIVLAHPYGNRIKIKAAVETTLIFNNIVSLVSNAAGDHSLTVNFNDVSSCSVGDFITVKTLVGIGDFKSLEGTWEVTAVNTGSGTLTLKVKDRRASRETFTVTSGSFKKQNSIIKAIGCTGIVVNKDFGDGSGQKTGLHDICIVGDGTPLLSGILVEYSNKLSGLRTKVVNFGRYGVYGIYNATINGLLWCASGNGSNGFYMLNGAVGQFVATISTGNNGNGYVASIGSVISSTTCNGSGNLAGQYGIQSQVISERSFFDGNVNFGVFLDKASYSDLDGTTTTPSTTRYNGQYGIRLDNGSEALFDDAISSNNGIVDFRLDNDSKLKVKDTTYSTSELSGLSVLSNLANAPDELSLDRLTAKEYVKTQVVRPLN